MEEFKPLSCWITCPDGETARHLAAALLDRRQAACVQILEGLESHYWWEGRQEVAREILLLAKTGEHCRQGLLETVAEVHPHQVPQVVFLDIVGGLPSYLRWMDTELRR